MTNSTDPATPAQDPRWQLALRVAATPGFQKSTRLKDFLLYVCERALAGHIDEISEQQIGTHVFGRPTGYSPGEDNIVRSQARLLRLKLESYFAGIGKAEPLIIAIPKGSYVPVFDSRALEPQPDVVAAAEPAAANPPHLPAPATPAAGNPLSPPKLAAALATLAIVLAGTVLLLAVDRHRAETAQVPGQSSSFAALWNALLNRKQPTMVIVSDHAYGLLQEAAERPIPAGDYISGDYLAEGQKLAADSGLGKLFPHFESLHLTGLHAITDLMLIVRLPQASRENLTVRFARDLNMRDFSDHNVILLGTPHTNPWMELLDKNLDFQFEWDFKAHEEHCRNRAPRPGELAEYRMISSGNSQVTYGGVAFVPTPNRQGNALLIFGTSLAGGEVSAEFITNEKFSLKLLDQLTRESGKDRPTYFEVLLKTTSVGGQPREPEVVAYRVLSN